MTAKEMLEELGYVFESYGSVDLIQFTKTEEDYRGREQRKRLIVDLDKKTWKCIVFRNVFDYNELLIDKIYVQTSHDYEESKAIFKLLQESEMV